MLVDSERVEDHLLAVSAQSMNLTFRISDRPWPGVGVSVASYRCIGEDDYRIAGIMACVADIGGKTLMVMKYDGS